MPGIRWSIWVAAIAAVAAAASACTTLGERHFTPRISTDAAGLNPAIASVVASDMADNLSKHVGQGRETIVLKSDGSAFGLALEDALRALGYSVTSSQTAAVDNPTLLAYAVDTFEGAIMARISTPSIELTRSYTVSESAAVPASPVAVMLRKS